MKKLFLLFILLSAMANQHPCFAQNNGSTALTTRIDSLKNELISAKKDTAYLDLLNTISSKLFNISDYPNARKYANEAITLADQLIEQSVHKKTDFINKCKWAKANSINLAGNLDRNESNYPEALKNYSASLKIREQIGDRKGIAGSYNNIGLIYWHMNNNEEALKKYFASLKIKEELGDQQGIANSNANIGDIYSDQGNYQEALTYYSTSLKIREEIGDKIGIAASYNKIGSIYKDQGNYTEAEKYYSASLKIREEIGDKSGIATSYQNIANVYLNQGKLKEALDYCLTSLKLTEKIGYKKGIAPCYNTIGLIYKSQGNYTEALKNYSAALKISVETGDKKFIGASYSSIGSVYSESGNYTEALKNHKAASKISEESGDKKSIAVTYNNIGNIYFRVGNRKEALKFYSASLKIRQDIGDRLGVATSYINIAAIREQQANYSEALNSNLAALKISEEIGNKLLIAGSCSNIANNYLSVANYTKEISADSINELSSLAIRYQHRSLKLLEEMGNKDFMTRALLGLGAAQMKNGKPGEAVNTYMRARDFADSMQLKKELGDALLSISSVYSQTGKHRDALFYSHLFFQSNKSFLSENFNSLTEKDKSSFKKTAIESSDDFFSNAYFMKSGFDDSLQWLYDYQLFQRGIVLESSSGFAASVQQDTSLQELWAKFSGYKNIIGKEYLVPLADRREDLSALEDSANNLERELLVKSIAYRNWKERVSATWQDVQRHLAKDEAAVEFVSFELQRKGKTDSILYAAMVLTSKMKYPKLLFLFEEKQLAGLLKNTPGNTAGITGLYTAMRSARIESSSSGALQFGDSLYKLILQPLAPYLKNVKTISFVPDGLLNKISMAAIPTPGGKPLCNKYQLRQMASTRNVAFPPGEPKSQPAAFFGGIDYTYKIPNDTMIIDNTSFSLFDVVSRSRGSEFSLLEGTKEEAEALSNLYKTKKYEYQLIEGKNATEKTFKQLEGKSPAVLHIATHGFFFPSPGKDERNDIGGESNYSLAEDPLLRSGLVLAGGNYAWKNNINPYEDEDGILTAYEISNLNLSTTDLVILSACETGLGDIQESEGVYGLQRAFKTAGVKYIIMSLWQVPDKETQEFMQTFYSKWLNGKPIRSAFRETQLDMSARYDPYQWAAFVMVE